MATSQHQFPPASTATITPVAGSIASVSILALNANRLGATIVNHSNVRLYLKYGETATLTDFTRRLEAGETFKLDDGYTGRIDGIWQAVASGFARVTELTP